MDLNLVSHFLRVVRAWNRKASPKSTQKPPKIDSVEGLGSVLGGSWGNLEASWTHLEVCWGGLGGLGAILGGIKPILEGFWGVLEASWERLGGSQASF